MDAPLEDVAPDAPPDATPDGCTGDDCPECEGDDDCEFTQICQDGACVPCAYTCSEDHTQLLCGSRIVSTCECEMGGPAGAQCTTCEPGCMGPHSYETCTDKGRVSCDRCQDNTCQLMRASNIASWPEGPEEPLAITLSGEVDFDTEASTTCNVAHETFCVRHVASLSVNPGAVVTLTGTRPLIILSDGDVQIDGRIVVQNGARLAASNAKAEWRTGGGGGGFAGAGGAGGESGNGDVGAGGESEGSGALIPLRGGHAGGNSDRPDYPTETPYQGGDGGGALQISARGSITIQGSIVADGEEGRQGIDRLERPGGGSGGGSGGGILLESPQTVIIGGLGGLSALGGPGGDGGRSMDSVDRPEGGDGGTASMPDGRSGAIGDGMDVDLDGAGGGGGGGGAGYVVIRADMHPGAGMIHGVYEPLEVRWSDYE